MPVYRIPGEASKRLAEAERTLDTKVGKVGWFENHRYPDENGKAGAYVAQVAASNEFGDPSKNVPARPFIIPTIDKEKKQWANYAEKGVGDVIKGKLTVSQVFEVIGAKAAGDIREAITQVFSPPLQPSTIAARLARRGIKNGNALTQKKLSGATLSKKESGAFGLLDKPLIDTKLMYSSLTNTVEDA